MLVTIIHVNQTYSNAPSILVGMGHHQRVSDLSLKDLARRLPFHTSVKFGLHMLHPWHATSIGIMVIVISRHHSNAKQNLQHSQLNHALGKYQLELTSRKAVCKTGIKLTQTLVNIQGSMMAISSSTNHCLSAGGIFHEGCLQDLQDAKEENNSQPSELL